MNWIKNLFSKKEVITTKMECHRDSEWKRADNYVGYPKDDEEWIEFDENNPPTEVVLAACDSYDCGWIMDTMWWDKKEKCWMTTGSVVSGEGHMPYSHWRKLPAHPKTKKQ